MPDVKHNRILSFIIIAAMNVSCSSLVSLPEMPQSGGSTIDVSGEDRASRNNTVCNHQFTNDQIRSNPNFSETEDNTIITGRVGSELLRSLINTVPGRGVGNTKWDLKWSIDSLSGLKGCSVGRAETQVVVKYQLPLWPDQLFATNRDLTDKWSQYSDALRNHHCMHGKTGIDASIEVKESLKRMAPRRTCTQLEADADALARSIIGKYKELESGFTAPLVTDYTQ